MKNCKTCNVPLVKQNSYCGIPCSKKAKDIREAELRERVKRRKEAGIATNMYWKLQGVKVAELN